MGFETISIIGLGYIGLPTAAVFASRKVKVIGVDVSQHVVDTINKGKIHIVEPDLDIAVHVAVTEGYLKATTMPEKADAFIIAVPTPFYTEEDSSNLKPDLSYIKSACEAIAPVLEKGNLIILESTSPVGATEKMVKWLSEYRQDLTFPLSGDEADGSEADINIAHCPERVLPGHIMRELIENDRIIGGITRKCAQRSAELYKAFVKGECIITTARTAEMAKLTENSFRDVNIAFANELSMICEKLDINVWELIKLSNRHPRVNILQPGCGVGGHCIAVDPWFIVDSAPEQAKIVRTAREVNDYKPQWVVEQIIKKCNKQNTKKVVCMGIAFKPDIDDLRESPALAITEKLAKLGYEVTVVEPNITELPERLQTYNIRLEKLTGLTGLDVSVQALLVAHSPFKQFVDLSKSTELLDFCGLREE
ncbi:MAG: UDP-N-acetyl-D-mannosamine dehydrogenase [Colwellia sp.]|nr:UDP-N-acetyl-D-mannosamine dehydrogenase [Colwellia sp.]